MSSFKLEKGGSNKDQALQAGVFLALIGVPVLFLVAPTVGLVMILLGTIVAIGARFASS